MQVQLDPPSPHWPQAFAAEAHSIHAALAGLAVKLHHIGSTSIRGIVAKPILDMLLVVPDLAALDRHSAALGSLGYEALGEFGIAGRRYFRKHTPAGLRSHHLHAFAQGSPHVGRHLAFRDYLNAHPAMAQAYGELKRALAARFPDDMQAYVDGKDGFIKEHEAKALAWVAAGAAPTRPSAA